jgi:hypothetical protein
MSKKEKKKRRKEEEKEQEKAEKKARKAQKKAAAALEAGLDHVPYAPEPQPGTYSDGHPLDEVHYLECKLILRADRFTSVKSFREFAEFVRHAAAESGVGFDTSSCAGLLPQIREVLFLDTPDFRLYNNAFILRRRTLYENGFPVGEPEIVFKFRHPDLQTAAETDVRPSIPGPHLMKFKAEALPLKERVGGFRLLYSHTVQFLMSAAPDSESRTAARDIEKALPVLQKLSFAGDEPVQLVNQMIVEEVLQDLGVLDFGKGITAKSSASLWRSRGEHRSLVGEFSFQTRFRRRDELHEKALHRVEEFFIMLQEALSDWVSLSTTKTGIVYGLYGNPPQAHE